MCKYFPASPDPPTERDFFDCDWKIIKNNFFPHTLHVIKIIVCADFLQNRQVFLLQQNIEPRLGPEVLFVFSSRQKC